MSQKITKDAGDVASAEKTKQRRTIRVEKQLDSHGSARYVKQTKSTEGAKVLMNL